MSDFISFIHIPKNAGMSFSKLCIANKEKIKFFYHRTDVFDTRIPNQLIILQNPVSRFKSSVRYAFENFGHIPIITYLKEKHLNTPNAWVNVLRDPKHPEYDNLMKEMLNKGTHFIGNKKTIYQWTYCPQTLWVNNPKYVILFENLKKESDLLLNKLNIAFDIPHINKTVKNKENDFLSEENSSWLESVFYKEDVEIYNKYKQIPVSKRLCLSEENRGVPMTTPRKTYSMSPPL
jgi:hypothetical protein